MFFGRRPTAVDRFQRTVAQELRRRPNSRKVRGSSIVVVVNVVANISTEREAQIPLLIRKAGRETKRPRSHRALVEILVGFSDLSVTIAVDYNARNGLAVLAVNLLINVVGEGRLANSVCLGVKTSSSRDTTYCNIVVLVATDKFCDFVLVVSGVEVDVPEPVIGLDGFVVESKFETCVLE